MPNTQDSTEPTFLVDLSKKSGLDRPLLCQLQMGDPVHDGISLLLDELVLYSDRIILHDIFLEKLSTIKIQKNKTFTTY